MKTVMEQMFKIFEEGEVWHYTVAPDRDTGTAVELSYIEGGGRDYLTFSPEMARKVAEALVKIADSLEKK